MHVESKSTPFYKQPWKWVLILFVVACLSLFSLWYAGRSSLGKELAKLRERGLPTTGAELNDYYRVPEDADDTTDLWVAAIGAIATPAFNDAAKDLPVVGVDSDPIPPPNEEWERLVDSREFLASMSEQMAAIRTAAEAGGVARFPVDFTAGFNTLLPFTQDARTVARMLVLDANVCAHEGDFSQAHQDVLGIYAVAEAFQTEPTLISQLVRFAVHSMGHNTIEELMPHCNWNDQQLEELQVAIAVPDFRKGIKTGLNGERAFCMMGTRAMTLGPFYQMMARDMLSYFEQCTEAASKDWSEALDGMQVIDAELQQRTKGTFGRMMTMPMTMFLPAAQQTFVAAARADTRKNIMVMVVAVERYRLKHGELPGSLDDITPEYLPPTSADLKMDHFDGRPLRFKVDSDGLIIYSIGDDREDHGGDIEETDEGRQPLDLGILIKR